MITEMKRVCKQNGRIIVIDAVYPKNPLGFILFKIDRGRYRRKFKDLKSLLLGAGFKEVSDGIKKHFSLSLGSFFL
jgi:hypothetical protein